VDYAAIQHLMDACSNRLSFPTSLAGSAVGLDCGLWFLFATTALKRLVVALQETRLLPSSMSC
jgi:hypothetical protein